MVFDLEETWLLYATQVKAAVNKQMKAFGSSWKKALHNELSLLSLTQSVRFLHLYVVRLWVRAKDQAQLLL